MRSDFYKITLTVFVFLITLSADAQRIATIAGNGVAGGTGDGSPATAAELNEPYGVAPDDLGNVFITNTWGHGIRKINTSGIITTVAGLGTSIAYNGGPATASYLIRPGGITFDGMGNYYITDINIGIVLKVNTAGNIYKIAGNATTAYTGDGGPATAAGLNSPTGVAVDGAGNVYIADELNNVVRKVTAAGIITTVAGNGYGAGTGTGGYSGDGGPATLAELNYPAGVAVDGSGNLFIADAYNSRVRKVNLSGIITTVAGAGIGGSGSPATAAYIGNPIAVAVDASGNLFIADYGSSMAWKVNTSGIIYKLAGTGLAGFSGDGSLDTLAQLNSPTGIAIDAIGNIYIADQQNNRIRKIDTSHVLIIPQTVTATNNTALFPNPNTGIFTLTSNFNQPTDENLSIEISNILGQPVYKNTLLAKKGTINKEFILDKDLPAGVYLLHIIGDAENEVLRFVIEK